MAYTQDGIQETIPPKKFSWADKPKMTFEYKTNQSFAIDKGIYDFNTINKFNDIQTFTGERESSSSTITNNVRKDGSQKGGIVDGKINVEKAFPAFRGQQSRIKSLEHWKSMEHSVQSQLACIQ